MQVDAHQHFWHPGRGDYGWMPKDDPVLARPYARGGPEAHKEAADLAPALAAHGIDRTVLVQAAPSVEETEYLLGIADATEHVGAVVGWVDFEQPGGRSVLERLKGHPKFRGVRPMVQDIADDDWLLREDIQWAFAALVERDLTFDALGFPRHLGNFLAVLKRYPDLRAVVDHCMKPQISERSEEAFRFWAEGIARIAGETGAYCKLSALVTEAGPDWTPEDLRPYVAHVLDAFGPERVMWGSDWPVCRLRAEYGEWRGAAEALTEGLAPDARARIFGETAAEFYRIAA